jgi:hypothetical protein
MVPTRKRRGVGPAPRMAAAAVVLGAVLASVPERPNAAERGALAAPAKGPPARLALDGVARWPIVVGVDASARVRDAAELFADLLSRISGAAFEVVEGDGLAGLAVGVPADFPQLDLGVAFTPESLDGREDYLLRSHCDGVWLVGATPLAAQHAVWDALGRLGYRFYFPAPNWELVPRVAEPVLAVDVLERPSYRVRAVGSTPRLHAMPWFDEPLARWRACNRVESDFQLSSGHAYQFIRRRQAAEFAAHPEYLALVDGERTGDKFCISNAGLRALVVSDAIAQAAAAPGRDSVSLEPSDGGGWCECPACAELGSPSDRAVLLANEAAAGLEAAGHDATYVGMYAYNWHSPPPSIDVHPKVIVSLESTHIRGGVTFEEMLAGWGSRARQLGIRESYGRTSSSASGFLPGGSRASDLAYLRKTIPEAHAAGARFLIGGGNAQWGVNGLGYYLASRLLWDIHEADRVEELVAEFLRDAFGPAAEPMREYFSAIDRGTTSPFVPGLALPIPHRMALMYRSLAAARACETSDSIRARIDDLVLYTRFVDLAQTADRSQGDCDALVAHLWRMRSRNVTDTVNTLQYFDRFVIRPAKAIAWPPGGSWRRPADGQRHAEDVPFGDDEIMAMLADGTRRFPVPDIKVETVDFGPGLMPGRFPSDAPRGKPAFRDTLGHRGPLTLELWSADTALPVLHLSAGHCWPGRGPLRWSLYDESAHLVESGSIASAVDPPRSPVTAGDSWRGAPATQSLRLIAPRPGCYRLEIRNTDQGFFWDYEPRPGTGLAQRADPQFPLSGHNLSRHYFYVPKGLREVHVSGQLRSEKDAWLMPDGRPLPADRVVVEHGFTRLAVPSGLDGDVWSFVAPGNRAELRFLNVPGYLAFHPSELLVPRSLAHEMADRGHDRHP